MKLASATATATAALANVFVLAALPTVVGAWTLAGPPTSTVFHTRLTTTRLFNVPPPSTSDKVAFREYANKQSPPASFYELQQDCIRSACLAIQDGELLLEVEFPPLPSNVLELDDVSAYDVASANLNLALDFSKGMVSGGHAQNIAILLPDAEEAQIALERMTGKKDQKTAPITQIQNGVTVSSLRRSDENDDRFIKVRVAWAWEGAVGWSVESMDFHHPYIHCKDDDPFRSWCSHAHFTSFVSFLSPSCYVSSPNKRF